MVNLVKKTPIVFQDFSEFYKFYVAEHRNPICRRFHFACTDAVALVARCHFRLTSIAYKASGHRWGASALGPLSICAGGAASDQSGKFRNVVPQCRHLLLSYILPANYLATMGTYVDTLRLQRQESPHQLGPRSAAPLNDFVRQGGIPIKMVRRILLPGDTGAAL